MDNLLTGVFVGYYASVIGLITCTAYLVLQRAAHDAEDERENLQIDSHKIRRGSKNKLKRSSSYTSTSLLMNPKKIKRFTTDIQHWKEKLALVRERLDEVELLIQEIESN